MNDILLYYIVLTNVRLNAGGKYVHRLTRRYKKARQSVNIRQDVVLGELLIIDSCDFGRVIHVRLSARKP